MSTRSGTQCGWSCRADGPGARGEEGPRPKLGSVQDRRIWKKVCPGEERGQLLPWEEAPIGRVYTSDRSPLGGGVLSASLGILLSVLLLGVSQWSGHCRPASTPRFPVPRGCHLSGGERLVCSFWVSPQLLASPSHSPWSPGPCTFGPASFWGVPAAQL